MSKDNSYPEIEEIKNNIIDKALLFGSTLGSISYMVGLIGYNDSEHKYSYISDFVVLLILVLITFFRKKIRIEYKTLIVILVLFVLIGTDVINLGLYSENKELLILIPFLAYLTYSFKRTILIYILGIIGFLFLGYLHFSGIIEPTKDYNQRALLVHPWIINVLLISIVSFVIIVIVENFNSYFIKLIDNLKKKNFEIAESEQNYREIFNTSSDAIFIHNLQGNILDVNDAMLNMYGYDKSEVLSLSINDFSSGQENYTSKEAMKHLEDAAQNETKVFDWHAKKKSGVFFWIEVVLKKTKILGDERILAVIRDIDEKKNTGLQLEKYKNHLEILVKERTEQLEISNKELLTTNEELYSQSEEIQFTLEKLQSTQEQLVQFEKMASIGVLAAGVAHEINNPLNFIQGGLSGLEEFFEENKQFNSEENKQLLAAIGEGIKRAAAIVSSLNHINRKGDSKMELCNVNSIIENCLVILNSQIKNKINIIKDFISTPPMITGNDGELHQAILNILINAEQAIEGNGEIKIQTLKENGNIIISISDNGTGIDKDVIFHITEPFFTTKEPGMGTGLGLSITYNIIQEHFGNLEYKSTLGEGTTAIITLPVTK